MIINANESMMAILNKHIGKSAEAQIPQESNRYEVRDDTFEVKNSKKMEVEAFVVNAKNGNEAIGVLQSAKKSLNKVLGYRENMEWVAQIKDDSTISQKDKRELVSSAENMAAEVKSLLDNTTFMGKKVFGTTMSIDFGAQKVDFEIKAPNVPKEMNQKSIESMFDQSSSMVEGINGAIKDIVGLVSSAQSRFDNGMHDFSKFEKDSFKKMF